MNFWKNPVLGSHTNYGKTVNLFSSVNTLLILGLIVRLLPAAFTAHPLDIESWKTVGAAIYSGQNPYALPAFGLVYPPLWGFICGMAYAIYASTQSALVFNFVIKLPIILADLALATNIRKFVSARTGNEKAAKEGMVLYLFNPVAIILSGIWGMFDSIPVFLVLLSAIFLFNRQYVKSSVVLGIAIAFKGFYPAMLLPFFVYVVSKAEGEIREAFKYLVISVLVPFIISAPFLIADAASFVNMTVIHFEQRQLSNLTYWFPIRLAFSQNQNLVSFMAFMSFVVFFPLAYIYLLKRSNPKMLMLSMSQIILVFFLTSPTVNEQYLLWLLMPMIIQVTLGSKKLKKFLYALTGITAVFILANTGPLFLSPLIEEFGLIQQLWPITSIMLICTLLFIIVSILTLRKTIKEDTSKNEQMREYV